MILCPDPILGFDTQSPAALTALSWWMESSSRCLSAGWWTSRAVRMSRFGPSKSARAGRACTAWQSWLLAVRLEVLELRCAGRAAHAGP